MPTFSQVLLQLRRERKLTQKQVAQDLGISSALLSHYEKGVRECGLPFLVRAADYYHVTCDYLLGRTDDRTGITPELASAEGDAIDERQRLVLHTAHLLFGALNAAGQEEMADDATDATLTLMVHLLRHVCATATAADAATALAAVARSTARVAADAAAGAAVSPEELRRDNPRFTTSLDRALLRTKAALEALQ